MKKLYSHSLLTLLSILTYGCTLEFDSPPEDQNTTVESSIPAVEIQSITTSEFIQRYNQSIQVIPDNPPLLKEYQTVEIQGEKLNQFTIDKDYELTLVLNKQTDKIKQIRIRHSNINAQGDDNKKLILIVLGSTDAIITQDLVPNNRIAFIIKILQTAKENQGKNSVTGTLNNIDYSANVTPKNTLFFSITPVEDKQEVENKPEAS